MVLRAQFKRVEGVRAKIQFYFGGGIGGPMHPGASFLGKGPCKNEVIRKKKENPKINSPESKMPTK